MKQLLPLLFVSISFFGFSQDDIKTNGIFYKISLATTLTINEDYTLAEDDTGPFFKPNAFFLNNTIGYQFDNRSTIGLNAEYNWHSESGLQFFPMYLNFQYNVFDFDDKVFIRGGYGRLIDLGKVFETGTLYKVGLGAQIYDENYKNSWLIGLDFSRKRFGYRQTEKLSSVSIFLEFMLF